MNVDAQEYDAVVCTVGPSDSDADFTDLQQALDECTDVGINQVILVLNGTFGPVSLIFGRNPGVISYVLQSEFDCIPTVNNTQCNSTIQGAGHQISPLHSMLDIQFIALTFDLIGSVTQGLFYPLLHNVNSTFMNCSFLNFNGHKLIEQEPCEFAVTFTCLRSFFYRIKGYSIYLDGIYGYHIQGNEFSYCGGTEEAVVHLNGNEASDGSFIFSENLQYRIARPQINRCRYSANDTDWNARCNNGSIQCFDRIATEDIGTCPQGTIPVYGHDGNVTHTIQDYELYCRVYIPCLCNQVVFKNTFTNEEESFFVGNIIFDNGVILPCIPNGAVISTANYTFVRMNAYIGQSSTNQMDSWSSFAISSNAFISPTGCDCSNVIQLQINESDSNLTNPCIYGIDIQSYCSNGDYRCCIDQYISPVGDALNAYYAVNCTIDETLEDPEEYQEPTELTEYLYSVYQNCSYYHTCTGALSSTDINGCISGGSCELAPCRVSGGVLSVVANTNMTNAMSYCTAWNQQVNCTGKTNAIQTTDPLCKFLLSGCLQYYTNEGYVKPEYQFSANISALGPICSFRVQDCNVPCTDLGNCTTLVGGPFNNDSRCYCHSQGSNGITNQNISWSIVNAVYSVTYNVSQNVSTGEILSTERLPEWVVVSNTSDIQGVKPQCKTQRYINCPCPEYYSDDDLVQFQDPVDGSPVTVTYEQCKEIPECMEANQPPDEYSVDTESYGPIICELNDEGEQVSGCDCSINTLARLNPSKINSTAYFLETVPPTTSNFEFINNAAFQQPYALIVRNVELDVMRRFTINTDPVFDRNAMCRGLALQDGEFLDGYDHDCVENMPASTLYRRTCDNRCPVPLLFTQENQYECTVDANASPDIPGYGDTIFPSVNDALVAIKDDNRCPTKTLLIKYNEMFYSEQMTFTKEHGNMTIASLSGAVIVGSGHVIEANLVNLTFYGIYFMHPGDNTDPLFIFKDVGVTNPADFNCIFFKVCGTDCPGKGSMVYNLRFMSCVFDGSGVRNAGIFKNRAKIGSLSITDCSILSWNHFAINLEHSIEVQFSRNTIRDCIGRCIRLGVLIRLEFNENKCLECHGGSLRGAEIFSIFLKDRRTCENGHKIKHCGRNIDTDCHIHGNHIFSDIYYQDQDDIGIRITWGSLSMDRFTDTVVQKARFGVIFAGTIFIGAATANQLCYNNPLVRPTLFRSKEKGIKKGNDFKIYSTRNFKTTTDGSSFKYVSNYAADFPCTIELITLWANKTFQCMVNNNWDLDKIQRITPNIPAYGFYQYNNISDAARYCHAVTKMEGSQVVQKMSDIYVLSENGSRFISDNITLSRDHWIRGVDERATCKISHGYPPAVFGQNHTYTTKRSYIEDIAFYMSVSDINMDLWSIGSTLPVDIRIWRCIYDGMNRDPESTMRALALTTMGVDYTDREKAAAAKKNKLPPFTHAYVEIVNCTFRNFAFYHDDLNKNVTRIQNEVEFADSEDDLITIPASFPYTNGVEIGFINKINVNTTAVVRGCIFENIDRSALRITVARNVIVEDNVCRNVSGRSFDMDTAIYIRGNPYYSKNDTRGWLLIRNNTVYQQRDVIFPHGQSTYNPPRVSCYAICCVGANGSLCFLNNTCSGLPYGARFYDINDTTISRCNLTNVTAFFPDTRRHMRAICEMGNQNVTGTEHDLVHGPGYGDEREQNPYCDNCCVPKDPLVCYVDITLAAIPENPWYGKFLFTSINDAILNCQSKTWTILVIGSQYVFEPNRPDDFQFETSHPGPKQYNETISVTVTPRVNRTLGEPLTIQGSVNSSVCGSDTHWIDNPYSIPIFMRGMTFIHCASSSEPTWRQNILLNSANMKFIGNEFKGGGVTNMAFDGVVDSGFAFNNNLVVGYDNDIAVRIEARNCDIGSMSINGNNFRDCPGAALIVHAGDGYSVRSNTFSNCGGSFSDPKYVVEATVCKHNGTAPIRFSSNNVRGIQQITLSNDQLYTAIYLHPLPTGTRQTIITYNRARGFDVGLRLDDIPNYSPPLDPKRMIRDYSLRYKNILCEGAVFDLVLGNYTMDDELVADPETSDNIGRWCNNGCPDINYTFPAMFVILMMMLCFIGGFMFIFCRPTDGGGYHYDQYLGMMIPNERRKWLRYNWAARPNGFYRNQPVFGNRPGPVIEPTENQEEEFY